VGLLAVISPVPIPVFGARLVPMAIVGFLLIPGKLLSSSSWNRSAISSNSRRICALARREIAAVANSDRRVSQLFSRGGGNAAQRRRAIAC
jgi:hypothetical protein